MVKRPLSAPASAAPLPPPPGNGNNDHHDTPAIPEGPFEQLSAQIEQADARNMQLDNRGHKLPADETLVTHRRYHMKSRITQIPPPQSESEFEAIEKAFCEFQHYRGDSRTAGLLGRDVRLLYSAWSQQELCRSAPRLTEAGGKISIRHDLAAPTLSILNEGLMKLIEEEHVRQVNLLQLLEHLNELLDALTEQKDDMLISTPSESQSEEEELLLVRCVALTRENVKLSQQYIQRLAGSRWSLVQAGQYGHLLGRFLIKLHRRALERSQNISTPSSSGTPIVGAAGSGNSGSGSSSTSPPVDPISFKI
jgi:hypothetical protein